MQALAPSSTRLPVTAISTSNDAARVPDRLDRGGNGPTDIAHPAPVQRPGAAPAELPRQDGSWSFAAIGDFGGDTAPHAAAAAGIAASNASFVLTLGDHAYPSGSEEDFARSFDPPHLLGGLRGRIPIRPAIGNHDVTDPKAEPFFRRFPELGGARWYSFDAGDVHVTSLDSTQSMAPGSPQHEWLTKDLASTTARWKVVAMHHPLESTQPRHADNTRLGDLGPTLARHGVDLLLAGHEHFYERWQRHPRLGFTQVISGSGGHGLASALAEQSPRSERRVNEYGYVDVEVQRDQLVGRMVRNDGSVADTFVIPHAADESD